MDIFHCWGRVTDGNRSDTLENRFNLTRIKDVLPNPESITMTADSKLFSGENLQLAKDYGLSLVTLMPKNLNCWDLAFDEVKHSLETATVIREQVRIDDESGEEVIEESWRGVGGKTVHCWTKSLENGEKLKQQIEVRTLVIRSTVLEAKKRKSGERLLEKERKKLAALDKRFSKKSQEYHCLEDASRAAEEAQKSPAQ
jgi:transposase